MTSSSQPFEPREAYKVNPLWSAQDVALARKIVRPQRGPTASIPDIPLELSLPLADRMMKRFKLDEYEGLVTAELPRRPIPQAFRTTETHALTELFKTWLPHIYSRIFLELEAPHQAINKVSRMGDPEFRIPDNKLEILRSYIDRYKHEGIDRNRRRIIEIYIRLQTEARKRKRQYTFMSPTGVPYTIDIGPVERTINVKNVGPRVASRVRAIFNMPVENLYKQILDTAIHNVFLKYPAFHHDMFGNRILPITPGDYHVCIDVKHFERHTADAVYASGILLEGQYAEITQAFRDAWYICDSDDHTKFFLIQPNFDNGFSIQFASGDSRVAPSQKEIFTCLIGEYIRTTRALSYAEAINFVFNGGDAKLTIRNYGDDNSYSGSKEEVLGLVSFLRNYLTVEEELPGKFLGFERVSGTDDPHIDDHGKWQLPLQSYLLKTHYNERPPYSSFRKFPNLGWVLKRQTFAQLGDPIIARDVYPHEDLALQSVGSSWVDIAWRAEQERVQSRNLAGAKNVNWLLGRDYAMTAAEKLATGEYFGLLPHETGPIIKKLIGPTWAKLLKW